MLDNSYTNSPRMKDALSALSELHHRYETYREPPKGLNDRPQLKALYNAFPTSLHNYAGQLNQALNLPTIERSQIMREVEIQIKNAKDFLEYLKKLE